MRKSATESVIKIGVDFDGVITTNPLRIARPAIAMVKHRLLNINKLSFFVPQNKWQKFIYMSGVVWPSVWPANGVKLLKKLSRSGKFQFFLVTGRYGFVKKDTISWLKKHQLYDVFCKIHINEMNEQPHIFKERIIRDCKFDFFIEDNWDIVKKLSGKVSTQIYWIYNLLDKNKDYQLKFSCLETALKEIVRINENTD